MAIYLYDGSILEKFKAWTNSANMHIYGPNESTRLFEIIADTTNDRPIDLPILSIRRPYGYTILNYNKKPLTYDGMMLESTCKKSITLNAIPISIDYQIDIYTRYYKEADEFMRNIIFNVINFPTLKIIIPYNNSQIIHNCNMRINSNTVEDNSDIPERLISGQFTRLTLSINIDDAYLWDVRIRDNYYIEPNFIID